MACRFKFREQWDDRADAAARAATDIRCEDEHLTQQQFREDADINVLARRFGIVGIPAAPPVDPAAYGDLREVPDLRACLDVVRVAKEQFLTLDPKVRALFGNDMARLHAFVSDPENRDQAVALGLLQAAPAPEVVPAPVVPPAASEAAS